MRYNLQDILESLKKESSKSGMMHKHAAACLVDNKIIIEHNKKINTNFTIHAEVGALFKCKKSLPTKLRQVDIIVIRYNHILDKLYNSRPCNSCINTMKKSGIRKVLYINENMELVYEYVDDMELKHISAMNRMRARMS